VQLLQLWGAAGQRGSGAVGQEGRRVKHKLWQEHAGHNPAAWATQERVTRVCQ
jgi:hypothetical protein